MSSRPRMRACRFSSVTSRGAPGEDRRERCLGGAPRPSRSAACRARMPSSRADSSASSMLAALVNRDGSRTPRHASGAERVHRHRGGQRRVDAARHAEHDARETVLAARSRAARAPSRGRPPGSRGSSRHAVAALAAQARRRRAPSASSTSVSVQNGSAHASAPSALIDERPAVEDELVLPADLVDVGERQPGLGDAVARQVAAAAANFSTSNGEPFGTSSSSAPCAREVLRDVGEPDVLADRQPEPDAAERRPAPAAAPARTRASRRRRRSWAARA